MVGEELLPVGEDLAVAVVEEQLTGSPINSALNEARISRRQLIAGRKALKSKRAKLNDESVNRNNSDGNSDANSQEDSADAPLKLSKVWSNSDAEDSPSDANDQLESPVASHRKLEIDQIPEDQCKWLQRQLTRSGEMVPAVLAEAVA